MLDDSFRPACTARSRPRSGRAALPVKEAAETGIGPGAAMTIATEVNMIASASSSKAADDASTSLNWIDPANVG
jgi:hypothetical protein